MPDDPDPATTPADPAPTAPIPVTAALPPVPDGDPGRYARNALERCKALRDDDRQECVARMQGHGTTSGSVVPWRSMISTITNAVTRSVTRTMARRRARAPARRPVMSSPCNAAGSSPTALVSLVRPLKRDLRHGTDTSRDAATYFAGQLEDYEYPAEKVKESLAHLPKVPAL